MAVISNTTGARLLELQLDYETLRDDIADGHDFKVEDFIISTHTIVGWHLHDEDVVDPIPAIKTLSDMFAERAILNTDGSVSTKYTAFPSVTEWATSMVRMAKARVKREIEESNLTKAKKQATKNAGVQWLQS